MKIIIKLNQVVLDAFSRSDMPSYHIGETIILGTYKYIIVDISHEIRRYIENDITTIDVVTKYYPYQNKLIGNMIFKTDFDFLSLYTFDICSEMYDLNKEIKTSYNEDAPMLLESLYKISYENFNIKNSNLFDRLFHNMKYVTKVKILNHIYNVKKIYNNRYINHLLIIMPKNNIIEYLESFTEIKNHLTNYTKEKLSDIL